MVKADEPIPEEPRKETAEIALQEQPGAESDEGKDQDDKDEVDTSQGFAIEKHWPHDWLDFHGDRLAVRKPPDQALIALSVSGSKFVTGQRQNDVVGLFIDRYLSPLTYDRVCWRMMDPDDPDYTVDTFGELMRAVSELKRPPAKSNGSPKS